MRRVLCEHVRERCTREGRGLTGTSRITTGDRLVGRDRRSVCCARDVREHARGPRIEREVQRGPKEDLAGRVGRDRHRLGDDGSSGARGRKPHLTCARVEGDRRSVAQREMPPQKRIGVAVLAACDGANANVETLHLEDIEPGARFAAEQERRHVVAAAQTPRRTLTLDDDLERIEFDAGELSETIAKTAGHHPGVKEFALGPVFIERSDPASQWKSGVAAERRRTTKRDDDRFAAVRDRNETGDRGCDTRGDELPVYGHAVAGFRSDDRRFLVAGQRDEFEAANVAGRTEGGYRFPTGRGELPQARARRSGIDRPRGNCDRVYGTRNESVDAFPPLSGELSINPVAGTCDDGIVLGRDREHADIDQARCRLPQSVGTVECERAALGARENTRCRSGPGDDAPNVARRTGGTPPGFTVDERTCAAGDIERIVKDGDARRGRVE